MRNEQLKYLLGKFDLRDCIPIIDNHIYYIKTPVKQAIILRCDESDLHWYISKPWRRKHVLNNALRTGVIREIWPENTSITCCYDYGDDCSVSYHGQTLRDVCRFLWHLGWNLSE